MESSTKPTQKSSTLSFMKYVFFFVAFVISFFVINIQAVEMLGLGLFFAINILFCVFIGKDLIDGSVNVPTDDKYKTEWMLRYGTLLISIAFSLVSSIMMIMTLTTLHDKFSETNSEIKWSQYDRQKLDDIEILFTTITTFIGVTAVYVYNSKTDIRKFVNGIFNAALNGLIGDWVRVTFPIITIALGAALYGRLEMSPVEVRKKPKQTFCDPLNDAGIQEFKSAFIKSYWCIIAFLLVVLARPLIEANLKVFGISPSMPFGFSPEDRTFIFGQNPAISIVSLLTFGVSNLTKINDTLKNPNNINKDDNINKYHFLLFLPSIFVWSIILYFFGTGIGITSGGMIATIISFALFAVALMIISKYIFKASIANILLLPILRWDIIYMLLKYGLGLAGLVYAGYSIKHFTDIPESDPCLLMKSYIRQLYIAFIFFLIVLYSFNTLSASVLTFITTNIMRYLVPPTLLGLSSYLVFITNYFVNMAPKLVVQ